MSSFMMRIEASQRSPLDQLVLDYYQAERPLQPSIDFCRRMLGVSERDEVVAKRLSVAITVVRSWRKVGQRANVWGCW